MGQELIRLTKWEEGRPCDQWLFNRIQNREGDIEEIVV